MSECIFCRIVEKEIPAKVVFENDKVISFEDINPQAPVHLLIIPKKHIAKVADVSQEDLSLVADIHQVAQQLAQEKKIEEDGFRLVVNNGANAGQAVDHVHYHLLGGRKLGWPPG